MQVRTPLFPTKKLLQRGAMNHNFKDGLSRGTISRTTKRVLLAAGRDLHTCERCQSHSYIPLPRHHKDRNRGNNTLENLEVLCVSCHQREHLPERKRSPNGKFVE